VKERSSRRANVGFAQCRVPSWPRSRRIARRKQFIQLDCSFWTVRAPMRCLDQLLNSWYPDADQANSAATKKALACDKHDHQKEL